MTDPWQVLRAIEIAASVVTVAILFGVVSAVGTVILHRFRDHAD